MAPGLTFPRAHCYNTRQCTAGVAAMPSVVPLLLLGGSLKNVRKETGRLRQTERKTVTAAIRLVAPMPLITSVSLMALSVTRYDSFKFSPILDNTNISGRVLDRNPAAEGCEPSIL